MIDLGFHCNRLRHLEPGVLDNGLARGEFYNFAYPEALGGRDFREGIQWVK